MPSFIAFNTVAANTSISAGVVYAFGMTRIPTNSFACTIGGVTMVCVE